MITRPIWKCPCINLYIYFKSCHDIYNLLIDRRNCVSEFSKIKKEIPEKFIKVLKGETTIVPERNSFFSIYVLHNLYYGDISTGIL
jgi:hypothetical protein